LATELGSAFISVGLGTNTLAGDIKKAFGSAESSGGDAGKSAGRGFGAAFGLAAAAAGALGIGSFFKSAVSGAADLEQSVGAVDSVFKGSAGQMHDWAKSAATDVGLSANEFNELGTLIGSQLKNGGTAMDELGPKTKALIGTGADLASMFGGSTQEAVEALSSALKGERDPIERYGVSLNQAKIDAEAAALGFKKVNGSFEQSAQQAATLSLITKQTADATGNFGRETDTLAHKQQVLSAKWADGKAAIGSALLPAVSALTGALGSALGPVMAGAVAGIQTVISGVSAMGSAFKGEGVTSSGFVGFMEKIGVVASQVFSTLGPIVKTVGEAFAPLIPQVLQIASSFSPLGLIFQAIQPVLPQLAAMFASLAAQLGPVLGQVLAQVTPLVQMLVTTLSGTLVQIMPTVVSLVAMLGDGLSQIIPVVAGVLGAVLPLVSTLISQLAPIITNLVTTVLPPIVSIFGNIISAIAPLITLLANLLIPIIQALLPVVVTVFGVIANVITAAMQIVQGIIEVVTGLISGNWDQVWTGIQNIFGGIWNTIVALVSGAIQTIASVIGAWISVAAGFVSSVLGNISLFFSDTWTNITNGVSGFISGFIQFFIDLPGKIMGALAGAGTWLLDVGKNIVQGLIDGVSGMVGDAVKSVTDIGGAMVDGVKGFLGIHSPSRVFKTQVGMMVGAGLIEGLDASQRGVSAAVNSLVPVPGVPSFGSAASFQPALVGAGGGVPLVQQTVYAAEGMSAETVGRISADQLNHDLRRLS
jgi:phage-related protein